MNAEHGEENVQVKPHAYVHRWSCFLRRSDGFYVFSMQALWKIYWRNFTINASQNEAVCREVQTHFGTSPLARFIKKLMGEISRFIRLKTNLFAMKLRRIWKFSPCKLCKTFLGAFSRFLRPKRKLLAMKFKHILEVLRLQSLRRKFCTNFYD